MPEDLDAHRRIEHRRRCCARRPDSRCAPARRPARSPCRNWFSSRTVSAADRTAFGARAAAALTLPMSTPPPASARRRSALRDAGQMRERAELGGDRDVVVGLRDDGRLAGERIAHQRELVVRAHQERVEAVEVLERLMRAPPRAISPCSQPPVEVAARAFGVAVGLEHARRASRACAGACPGSRASRCARGTSPRPPCRDARSPASPRDSVAMRVWPTRCVPVELREADSARATSAGSPTSL